MLVFCLFADLFRRLLRVVRIIHAVHDWSTVGGSNHVYQLRYFIKTWGTIYEWLRGYRVSWTKWRACWKVGPLLIVALAHSVDHRWSRFDRHSVALINCEVDVCRHWGNVPIILFILLLRLGAIFLFLAIPCIFFRNEVIKLRLPFVLRIKIFRRLFSFLLYFISYFLDVVRWCWRRFPKRSRLIFEKCLEPTWR